MRISLNPLYQCNFSCDFCYLTKTQLTDPKTLNLEILKSKLHEISEFTKIEAIDLYGGEVSLLSEDYWYGMKQIIREFYIGPINVISNLSKIHKGFLDDDIDVSVSYDFDVRQAQRSVRNNIMVFPKPLSVLILASEKMIQKDVDQMINELNLFANVETVEIKPYSSNQANSDNVSFADFESFVKRWIESPIHKNFDFINQFNIEDVIEGNTNSFSDDHIYITPNGKFGVLEFDLNDNEFFLELDSYNEYVAWTHRERLRVENNSFCSGCEYFGKCLSEHLREVKDISKSCNGFKNLINWYKNEIMEN